MTDTDKKSKEEKPEVIVINGVQPTEREHPLGSVHKAKEDGSAVVLRK